MSWKSWPSSHPAFISVLGILGLLPILRLVSESPFPHLKAGSACLPGQLRGLFGDKTAVREVTVALQREKCCVCLKDYDRESVLYGLKL